MKSILMVAIFIFCVQIKLHAQHTDTFQRPMERLDLAGKHLKKAKNRFVASGIFGLITLTGIAINDFAKPDTIGMFNDYYKQNKLSSYSKDFNAKMRTFRSNRSIVTAGYLTTGLITFFTFISACSELNTASGYLTLKKGLPLYIKPYSTGFKFQYRF